MKIVIHLPAVFRLVGARASQPMEEVRGGGEDDALTHAGGAAEKNRVVSEARAVDLLNIAGAGGGAELVHPHLPACLTTCAWLRR